MRRVRELAARPVCVGFGLSRPAHVAAVVEAGADLAIVGSHLLAGLRADLEAGAAREALAPRFEAACAPFAAAAREEVAPCS